MKFFVRWLDISFMYKKFFVVTVILMRFITCCKRKNYEYFEKNFSEEQNCYFDTVFASLIIVCYDFLRFSKKKNSLSKSMCIKTILSEDIHLCSICTVDLFKRVDEIIKFELRW